MLHDGPGAAASAEPSRRWEAISTALTEIGQDLSKALEQSGASWTGKAAGAAYDRLSVTAAWAGDTSAEAAGMRSSVETQAEHIARARADMPPPEDVPSTQPDPTLAPAVQVAKAQTDLEGAEAAASSAEEKAFEVMAAYELNTNTTTEGLATFNAPAAVDHHEEVHQGGANVGSQHTHAASAGLLDVGGKGGPGGGHGPGGPGLGSSVGGEGRRPFSGVFSGVLNLFGSNDRSHKRSVGKPLAGGSSSGVGLGSGSGSGSGGGAGGSGGGAEGRPAPLGTSAPAAGPSTGAAPKVGPSVGGMPASDFQAAAAGHAAAGQAAAVHQSSASPVAPAAGTTGGGQDRVALRRFGAEAIGSNQWFGDDEAVVGDSPRRRRDFKETEHVTESVDILGQEHKLPPTVIGDGQTDR
jgi:PPE family